MKKIKKNIKLKLKNSINEKIKENIPIYNFNKNNTTLDFLCNSCKKTYEFNVVSIFFDSLHNKEKFLINPTCPFCGEKENFSLNKKTFHFLSFLYKNNLLKNFIFYEPLIKELCLKYPNENLIDIKNLDDLGLQELERGNYEEVFRIFSQFIYINPNHHLGFEFISYAYYEIREFEKSLFFMEKAIERAEIQLNNNYLDKGIFSIINKNFEYMKRKQLIFRWWENL